jgi:hypothetical protein
MPPEPHWRKRPVSVRGKGWLRTFVKQKGPSWNNEFDKRKRLQKINEDVTNVLLKEFKLPLPMEKRIRNHERRMMVYEMAFGCAIHGIQPTSQKVLELLEMAKVDSHYLFKKGKMTIEDALEWNAMYQHNKKRLTKTPTRKVEIPPEILQTMVGMSYEVGVQSMGKDFQRLFDTRLRILRILLGKSRGSFDPSNN